MKIIDNNIKIIVDLCRQHKVVKLFVFGSVLTERFSNNSDIDLVVDFADIDIMDYANNYFHLKFSLENALGRNVDLLENKAIKNPFLRQSIDSKKILIYG